MHVLATALLWAWVRMDVRVSCQARCFWIRDGVQLVQLGVGRVVTCDSGVQYLLRSAVNLTVQQLICQCIHIVTIHCLYIVDYTFRSRIPFPEAITPNGRKAKSVLITRSVRRDIRKEETKPNKTGWLLWREGTFSLEDWKNSIVFNLRKYKPYWQQQRCPLYL